MAKRIRKNADNVDVQDNVNVVTEPAPELLTFKKIGGALGVAFGAVQLVNFGKEAVQLAGKVEGVRNAFQRLNQPNLLENLRTATRGTVNDLTLMQAAMRANNFQIPLENLARYFEFAQKRASQTGESVDFLVDSIVNGIGRKSPLILDNLGISAVRLREKFKGIDVELVGVGEVAKAVGDIVQDELAKMGNVALTTADRLAQLNAKWDNMKVVVGEGIVDVFSSFERLAQNTYGWLSKIASLPGGLLKKFGIDISDEALGITSPKKDTSGLPPAGSMERLAYEIREQNKKNSAKKDEVAIWSMQGKTIDEVNKRIDWLKEQLKGIVIGSQKHRDIIREIAELEDRITLAIKERPAPSTLSGLSAKDVFELNAAGTIRKPTRPDRPEFEPGIDLQEDYNKILETLGLIVERKEEDIDAQERVTQGAERYANIIANSFSIANLQGRSVGQVFADLALKLADMVIQATAFAAIMSLINPSGGTFLGRIGKFLGFAHGGSVANYGGGNVSVKKFASGGSFTVPPGYANDSFPIMVQSGERVTVTPAHQVNGSNFSTKSLEVKLDQMAGAINQLASRNINLTSILQLDSKEVAKAVSLRQSEFNVGNYQGSR